MCVLGVGEGGGVVAAHLCSSKTSVCLLRVLLLRVASAGDLK